MHNSRSPLSIAKLSGLIKSDFVAFPAADKLELWDTIDSTNNRAIGRAAAGAAEGTVILARQQTAGRGRQGKHWTSPPDSGVYASFIFRPDAKAMTNLSTITLAAGVAAAQAIESVAGVRIGLKWVNDLVYDGKKLGGILAELSNRNSSNALIIGIGINLFLESATVPFDLRDKMTWIEAATNQRVDPNLLVAELCLKLEQQYKQLLLGHSEQILRDWKERSITLGKQIKATIGDKQIEGLAEDISSTGALILRTHEGNTTELHAGEISIRTADGKYC